MTAVGVSAAAGAAIGSLIPVPVLGTIVGMAAEVYVGKALDSKLPYINKSTKQVAKDGVAGVLKISNKINDYTIGTFAKMVKSAF